MKLILLSNAYSQRNSVCRLCQHKLFLLNAKKYIGHNSCNWEADNVGDMNSDVLQKVNKIKQIRWAPWIHTYKDFVFTECCLQTYSNWEIKWKVQQVKRMTVLRDWRFTESEVSIITAMHMNITFQALTGLLLRCFNIVVDWMTRWHPGSNNSVFTLTVILNCDPSPVWKQLKFQIKGIHLY